MSTTKCNYFLQEIERSQSVPTMDAIAAGLESIPQSYYLRRETMEAAELFRAVALEQAALISVRAKIKALSSDKKWRPIMEELRTDLSALCPVDVSEDGEGRRRFRSSAFVSPLHLESADTYNNKVLDLVQEGVQALLEYSPERTFQSYKTELPFLVESSMYYSNGAQKPSLKWKYAYRTALEEMRASIGRLIEGHRNAPSEALKVEVEGTNGIKYRRANLLEAYTGNIDASKTVERYLRLFTQKEAQVFKALYVNGCTREQTADKYGLTVKAVSKTVERIKAKIVSAGYTSGAKEEMKEDNAGKGVDVFGKDGSCIGRFTSAKSAAEKLGVHRSHIQNVLAGKRKTAGGYYFCRSGENIVR